MIRLPVADLFTNPGSAGLRSQLLVEPVLKGESVVLHLKGLLVGLLGIEGRDDRELRAALDLLLQEIADGAARVIIASTGIG
jgi:hypothetical protein